MGVEGGSVSELSRRGLLAFIGGSAAAVGLSAVTAPSAALAAAAGPSKSITSLVKRSFVIDMLGVPSLDLRPDAYPYAQRLSAEQVAMFRGSGLTALHNAVGLGGPNAYADAMAFFAAWIGFVARNDDLFVLASNVGDLDRAKESGRIAVIMGLQNSEHFRTPADVLAFYKLGQRCSQLTYNTQNLLGSGGTERVDGGVSDFGAEVIAKMNEVGMLVDVSHSGDRTTLDAIEISKQPIAITHSNCRALNNHPRLKTDEAIKKLAAKGGVMGITGVRNFVRDREPTTVEHMVDHIDHVARLVGIEHVGIGTDSDLHGYDDMPPEMNKLLRGSYKASYAFRDKLDTDGFDDPKRIYNLTEALVRRGYSNAHIEMILGGNFKRLLAAVWK